MIHYPKAGPWIYSGGDCKIARYQAICACGFKGPARMSLSAAQTDADKHAIHEGQKGPTA